jgi:hypothetical protein
MAVGLLFHYEEDTIFHIKLALWEEVKTCWGFDNLLCIDLAGEWLKRKRKFTYSNIKSAIENNSDYQYIYLLSEEYSKNYPEYEFLHNFEHPEDNVIYIIGSDSFGIPFPLDMRNNSKIVSILTPCSNKGEHPIWAIEVATVVGYDRFVKSLKDK